MASSKPIGAPMKYRYLIENLEDDKIYSAAAAVAAGRDKFPAFTSVEDRRKYRLKARHSLSRFKNNHNFPRNGDGISEPIEGQGTQIGWKGNRWKAALQPKG